MHAHFHVIPAYKTSGRAVKVTSSSTRMINSVEADKVMTAIQSALGVLEAAASGEHSSGSLEDGASLCFGNK